MKIVTIGMLVGAVCVLLGAWIGAELRTVDIKTACLEQGWYGVSKAKDGVGGAAILCTYVTSEQLQQALEE